MSKSHGTITARKLMVFGTVMVLMSMVLAACGSSASPIPDTGLTPGVVSTQGVDLTPVIGGTSTQSSGGSATQSATQSSGGSATQSATMSATESSGGSATQPSSGALDPTAIASQEAEIEVADDSSLGQILVGHNGFTLYALTDDTVNTVTCTGACLAQWFPLATQGNPDVGSGVDKSLLGTAALAGGGQVVTYNGHPLYYFVGDMAKGDVNGQGVGNKWYVVSPAGELVQK